MFDSSGSFELQVAPNGRASADEYLHQGNIWIEGREGSRYVLRFINRLPQRVCVVFSVDGLDTIKGQPAGPNSEGYIVNANSTLEIPGWKVDSDTAAEFFFNKIGKSYAAASGANTSNVGVIGAMVFKEQYYQPYPTAYALFAGSNNGYGGMQYSSTTLLSGGRGSTAGSLASSGGRWANAVQSTPTMNAITSQDVGTGFGDATHFATTQATFNRANSTVPDAMLVMYYNTARNLQKMGIQLRTKGTRYDTSVSKAFPAYNNGCVPPPGWKP